MMNLETKQKVKSRELFIMKDYLSPGIFYSGRDADSNGKKLREVYSIFNY
jgi:hypothetical protein